MDHLDQGLSVIHGDAPETSSAFSATVSRAVGFLASKVPDQGKAAPLDMPREPSNAEVAKFNRYAHVVDKPISVLTHIQHGTLLPQDIEAVSTVYPGLYAQMKSTLVDKMTTSLAKHKDVSTSIPYPTKLALSMFLGSSLDSTMTPGAMSLNQGTFAINAAPPADTQTKPSKAGMAKMHPGSDSTPAQSAATRRANS